MLLAVILLFVSCGGEDDGTNRGTGGSQAPTPAPASQTPEEEPSFSDADPNGGPALPGTGEQVRVTTDAFEARALQHEIDHFSWKLFLDRVAGAHAIYQRKVYL